MLSYARKLCRNSDGAVAPIIALSLFGLIGVGGLAFDYARLAAMDTELQDAADHAALAAASQLDGSADAQTRATAAANNLFTNATRFARTDSTHTRTVAIVNLEFFSAYASASSNTAATGGPDSNFVRVTVDTRAADYAFTPIVGALYGTLDAKAVAGVSSAVCGVVPFFICNPEEPIGNTNPLLPPTGIDPGTGIVMLQGDTQWGPGNFGFLDQLGRGADGVSEALASNTLFGNCSATSTVTTETGNILNAVRDSLNMRFDFDPGNASSCKDPPCSPSTNVVKDVVKPAGSCAWSLPAMTAADIASNNSPPRYFPRDKAALPSAVIPQTMGFPRDLCHYFMTTGQNGTFPLCSNNRVGDGDWDRAAYFRANHPTTNWASDPDLGANVTRYKTYLWEASDPSHMPANKTIGTNTQYSGPQCLTPGLAPDPAGTDRRRITAAVVNCHATPALNTGKKLNGKKDLAVAGYIDVFLTEPSIDRTRCAGCGNFTIGTGTTQYTNAYGSNNDIYVEVIGASGTGEGGLVPQISRRAVPRLIE